MKRSTMQAWGRVALAIAALFLLWAALRSVSLAQVWEVLRRLTPGELVLLAILNVFVLITLTGRWWIFLVAQGYRLPYHQLIGYRLAGFGVSYFTPGPHLGGEPFQVYLVSSRHRVPYDASITAIALDKLVDMIANFTFLAVGVSIVLQRQMLPRLDWQAAFYALALLALPLALTVAFWMGKHPVSSALSRLRRLWPATGLSKRSRESQGAMLAAAVRTVHQSETRAIVLFQQQPSVMWKAVAISALNWCAMLVEFWSMTAVLELGLSLQQAIMVMIAARVAILLPIPAGLGVLEVALVMATSALGLGAAAGISLAILIRTRDVLLGLLGLWIGGVKLWRRAPIQVDTHLNMDGYLHERAESIPVE